MATIDLTRRFGRQRAPGSGPSKAGDGDENGGAEEDFLYVSLPQMTFYISPASKVVEVGETFATS